MIENQRQCENTRRKLRDLEELYEKKRVERGDDRVGELTLRSLKKRINQLKEEVICFEARTRTRVG